jgi:hypothetical protein
MTEQFPVEPLSKIAMNDDPLLQRADRAIRENQFFRRERLQNLMLAKAASARIKRTMQWARAERSRDRQIGLEMADMAVEALGNPEAKTASATSDER